MDNDLIDRSLIELQQLTHDQRTPELLQIWLSFMCEAAGIELGLPASIQHEQLKLEAAMALLTRRLGADKYVVALRICGRTGPSLSAFLYANDELSHQAFGSGRTASEALEKLRAEISRIENEALQV